jgi:hypothetical protein
MPEPIYALKQGFPADFTWHTIFPLSLYSSSPSYMAYFFLREEHANLYISSIVDVIAMRFDLLICASAGLKLAIYKFFIRNIRVKMHKTSVDN